VEEQILEISDYATSAAFSEEERAVLDYAVCMTRIPTDVPDELFARLRERFDEAQLVELTATIAQENFRARFNRPFEIGSVGFSEGAVCPIPER